MEKLVAMCITSPCCPIIVCLVLVFCVEGRPRYFVNTPIPGELDIGKAYTFSLLVCLKPAKQNIPGRTLTKKLAIGKRQISCFNKYSQVCCRLL